jgi:hypothetical protein
MKHILTELYQVLLGFLALGMISGSIAATVLLTVYFLSK